MMYIGDVVLTTIPQHPQSAKLLMYQLNLMSSSSVDNKNKRIHIVQNFGIKIVENPTSNTLGRPPLVQMSQIPTPMPRFNSCKKNIFWADSSHKKVIAVVKFHPFSSMDPKLQAQYEFLSQHLIAQIKFQNPNHSNGPAYSGEMYSLGWRKA